MAFAQEKEAIKTEKIIEKETIIEKKAIKKVRENKNSFGVKIGYNLSNISNIGGDSKSGINVGVVSEFFLDKKKLISISPGLSYSMQGIKDDVYGNGFSNDKVVISANYINLPVLLKAYFPNKKFSADIGFQFGYMVNMKVSTADVSVKAPRELFNSLDVSYVYGLSYNFSRITLSVRGITGLSNVIDIDAINEVSDTGSESNKNKNQVFELGFCFKF